MREVVYIAGVARSGTSWVGQIFESSPDVQFRFQPLYSYAFKNRVNEESSREEFQSFFADLYENEHEYLTQKDKRESGDYPLFRKELEPRFLVFKENRYQYVIEPMLRKCENLKVLGIIRNPCAVLSSWIKNPKEFPPGSIPLKEWRYGDCKNKGHEDFFGYYKWKEISHLYHDLKDKFPDSFYLLHYEELVMKPMEIAADMYEFMGIPFLEETRQFVRESTAGEHKESPYAVYKDKSVAEKWRNDLDPYIIQEVYADLTNTRLAKYLS